MLAPHLKPKRRRDENDGPACQTRGPLTRSFGSRPAMRCNQRGLKHTETVNIALITMSSIASNFIGPYTRGVPVLDYEYWASFNRRHHSGDPDDLLRRTQSETAAVLSWTNRRLKPERELTQNVS
jgi:hypothetical protein